MDDPLPSLPPHSQRRPGPGPGTPGQLDEVAFRPLRYQTVDGATELGWGAALVLFALSAYCSVPPLRDLPGREALGWILLAAAAFAPYGLQQAVKRGLTWPRTGYVRYRHDRGRTRWVMVGVGLVAGALAAAIPFLLHGEGVPSGGDVGTTGTVTGGGPGSFLVAIAFAVPNGILYGMLASAHPGRVPWRRGIWALIVVAPFLVAASGPSGFVPLARPMMLVLGLIWLVSGVATLAAYLRQSSAPVSLEPGLGA